MVSDHGGVMLSHASHLFSILSHLSMKDNVAVKPHKRGSSGSTRRSVSPICQVAPLMGESRVGGRLLSNGGSFRCPSIAGHGGALPAGPPL